MKWFKHESDANSDAKLKKVLIKYGAQGYGLYWYCLELIAAPIDKHNLSFELEHDCEILAHDMKMDTLLVEEIMKYMISQKLFSVSETTQRITCLQLAKRLENSIIKNPQLKEVQELLSETIPESPGQSGKSPARLDKTRLDESTNTSESAIPRCPTQSIIDLYYKHAFNLPKVRVIPDKTKSAISSRWRQDARFQTLDFWKDFFCYCNDNKFLSGRGAPRPGSEAPFRPDLNWLVKAEPFANIINEKYA